MAWSKRMCGSLKVPASASRGGAKLTAAVCAIGPEQYVRMQKESIPNYGRDDRGRCFSQELNIHLASMRFSGIHRTSKEVFPGVCEQDPLNPWLLVQTHGEITKNKFMCSSTTSWASVRTQPVVKGAQTSYKFCTKRRSHFKITP